MRQVNWLRDVVRQPRANGAPHSFFYVPTIENFVNQFRHTNNDWTAETLTAQPIILKNDSDTLAVQFTTAEVGQVVIPSSSAETLNVSFSSESNVINVSLSGPDTLAVAFSGEGTSVGVTSFPSATDTLSVAFSSENTLVADVHQTTDRLDVSITDVRSLHHGYILADTLKVSFTETPAVKFLWSQADTLAVAFASEIGTPKVIVASTDVLAVAFSGETGSLFVRLSSAEPINVRIGDAPAYAVVVGPTAETLSVSFTETTASNPRQIGTDRLDVSFTETSTGSIHATGIDTVNVAVGDLPKAKTLITQPEQLDVTIVEATGHVRTVLNNDPLAVSFLSEAPSQSRSEVSTDQLNVSLADIAVETTTKLSKAAADILVVSMTDASLIRYSPSVADALAVTIVETIRPMHATLSGADQLDVAVIDVGVVRYSPIATDALAVSFASEASTTRVSVVGLDTLNVALSFETGFIITAGPVVDWFEADVSFVGMDADLQVSPSMDAEIALDGTDCDFFIE